MQTANIDFYSTELSGLSTYGEIGTISQSIRKLLSPYIGFIYSHIEAVGKTKEEISFAISYIGEALEENEQVEGKLILHCSTLCFTLVSYLPVSTLEFSETGLAHIEWNLSKDLMLMISLMPNGTVVFYGDVKGVKYEGKTNTLLTDGEGKKLLEALSAMFSA